MATTAAFKDFISTWAKAPLSLLMAQRNVKCCAGRSFITASFPAGVSLLISILILSVITTETGQAQDVQTGHYAPGWNGALKAGVTPPDPGLYFTSTTMFFNARKFKDGSGNTVPDSDEMDYIVTALAIAWRPDFKVFGGDYMAVVTPAFGNLSGLPVLVNGELKKPSPSLGDMFFTPISLGWHWSEFHLTAALGGFAPTGRYNYGGSDNTGLGFWTFYPYVAATYRSEKGIFKRFPLLVMGGLRYEVHSNQEGRDFRPGDSFTFEYGLGLELGKRTDIGVTGFVYRQVTDPTGDDAKPVDKYESNGIGGHISHGIGPFTFALRGYQDFEVRNGPEGTLVYLEVSLAWPWKRNN
jgi:hypothetical protein